MEFGLICTITVAAVAVIYLIVGVIWGVKRGFARSLFRLVTLAAAAVIAFFITSGIIGACGDAITAKLLALADTYAASVSELLHASEALIRYVLAIAIALLAPLLYTLLFLLLRVLLWILYAALCMFLPTKKKKPLDALSRVTGVIVSCVGCFLIVISLLMPFAGYLRFAAESYPKVVEAEVFINDTLPAGLDETLAKGAGNKAVLAVRKLGGDLLFDELSRTASKNDSYWKEGLDLSQERDALLRLYSALYDVSLIDFNAIFDETKTTDLTAIKVGLIDAVGDSEIMKTILAEVLSFAAGKWQNGEEVLSVNIKEQLPDEYKSALDEPLTRLSGTTRDTVCEDLRDLACSIETISDSYVYLHKVSRTVGDDRIGKDELQADMEQILGSLTPGSAQMVSSALTSTIENNETLKKQVGEENTAAIAEIVADSLTGIAEMDEEEKKAEAAAINNLISYTTTSRRDEVTSDELLDDILASKTIRSMVQEKGKTDEETGEVKTTLRVTQKQKDEMDAVIDKRLADTETPLTEDEQATLEALRAMLAVKKTGSAGEGETTPDEGGTTPDEGGTTPGGESTPDTGDGGATPAESGTTTEGETATPTGGDAAPADGGKTTPAEGEGETP